MISEVLDDAKKRLKIESDYALAKALKVSPQHISNYRKGINLPDDATALRLAEAAGRDPLEVLACIHATRAKDPNVRRFWSVLGKCSAAIVAVFGMSVFDLGSMTSEIKKTGPNIHYANLLKAIRSAWTKVIHARKNKNDIRRTRAARTLRASVHQPTKTA